MRSGSLAVTSVLFPGDLLGDVQAGQGRWFELLALVPSRLLGIRLEPFHQVLAEHPDLRAWYVEGLAERTRLLERRLAEWMLLPVRDRIVVVLRDIAARRPGGDGRHVEIPITQEVLAQMVGVTRESANRAVHVLVREGRLRRSGRSYLVPLEGPERW
jgi:CRP/FNR family transcriptional regulator